jgi:hypothetical protein
MSDMSDAKWEEFFKEARSTDWDWKVYPLYSPAGYARYNIQRFSNRGTIEARKAARSDMQVFNDYPTGSNGNKHANLAISYCTLPVVVLLCIEAYQIIRHEAYEVRSRLIERYTAYKAGKEART